MAIQIKQQTAVPGKLHSYPPLAQKKLLGLRNLILEAATELNISSIEETLKWGEPSYLVKKGSTIRMDWKAKAPQQYALYFNCNTSLVETFRMLYGDLFRYEKNRALLFDLNTPIPRTELKACLKMALQYHLLKDKPLLGG
ncbi:MAG: DUF1801 domain-containing protein [Saprospiraceae bacterium]